MYRESISIQTVLACMLMVIVLPVCTNMLRAQTDSTAVRLKEVNIVGGAGCKVHATPAAVQSISGIALHTLPTLQLSDALKYLSGIVIRDYGGIGGIKTISVRGLGTQHTGVAYDGIPLTDCQTGQIDLGRLSTENTEVIRLIVGPNDPIFVPARLFSYSNLLLVQTHAMLPDKPLTLKAGITAGSYGLLSPSVFCENVIHGKKRPDRYWIWNLFANYMQSDGNYPYTLHYGGATDSTSREHRQNSDITVFNAECNGLLQLGTKQRLTFKAYYYNSQRGLPKATVFYNLKSAERLWNRNIFGQLHYHNYFSTKLAYQVNAKFNHDHTHYLNPDFLNDTGYIDNKYRQYEAYLSNTVRYRPFGDSTTGNRPDLVVALSHDVAFNHLTSNSTDCCHPSRWTTLTAIAAELKNSWLTMSSNILLTTVNNLTAKGNGGKNFVHLSPTVGARFATGRTFQIRTFYKNIFRMPTFNDLYYREVGNLDLNPEKTHQWNVGITCNPHFRTPGIDFMLTADGYFNIVKDKIVAFPNRNLFAWTMLNYGKVYIAGTELNAQFRYRFYEEYSLNVNGNFTYQAAVDRTDPRAKTFNHQIPYTPLLSGSASCHLHTPYIDLSYSMVWSGKRYALGQNIPANEVTAYVDQSILLGHEFKLRNIKIGLKAELLNLANVQYEIIRNYPMQGRSFRIKIDFSY